MCKKDSCCILLTGDKTADEIQCQYIQCNTRGKHNTNYAQRVIGHKLAITTQESGPGAIFGSQKKVNCKLALLEKEQRKITVKMIMPL